MTAESVLPASPPPDVVFVLAARDGGRVEIWMREGYSGVEFAAILREMADGFESGMAVRVG